MGKLKIPGALSLVFVLVALAFNISVPPEIKISFYSDSRMCIETTNSSFSILQSTGEIDNLSYWCSSGETEETSRNSEQVFVISADQFCLVSSTPVHVFYDVGYGNTWDEEVGDFCFGKMNLASPSHRDGKTSQSSFITETSYLGVSELTL